MTTDDILSALFSPVRNYQRDAMQAAADQWADVGPLLIARVLAQAAVLREDPDGSDDSMGLIYALTLFGHLRDETAWPAIVALCTLPSAVADDELGALATEDLGQILYRCCGPKVDELRALYANRAVDQWVRGGAYRALTYAVAKGRFPRDELLGCLVATLSAEPDPDWDEESLVDEARYDFLNMRPVEHAELARAWADDDVLFPDEVGEDLEVLLTESPEHWAELVQGWREELAGYEPEDLHARLQGWAAFEENHGHARAPAVSSGGGRVGAVKRITVTQAAKRNKKNKIAKKSRQGNRKKKK